MESSLRLTGGRSVPTHPSTSLEHTSRAARSGANGLGESAARLAGESLLAEADETPAHGAPDFDAEIGLALKTFILRLNPAQLWSPIHDDHHFALLRRTCVPDDVFSEVAMPLSRFGHAVHEGNLSRQPLQAHEVDAWRWGVLQRIRTRAYVHADHPARVELLATLLGVTRHVAAFAADSRPANTSHVGAEEQLDWNAELDRLDSELPGARASDFNLRARAWIDRMRDLGAMRPATGPASEAEHATQTEHETIEQLRCIVRELDVFANDLRLDFALHKAGLGKRRTLYAQLNLLESLGRLASAAIRRSDASRALESWRTYLDTGGPNAGPQVSRPSAAEPGDFERSGTRISTLLMAYVASRAGEMPPAFHGDDEEKARFRHASLAFPEAARLVDAYCALLEGSVEFGRPCRKAQIERFHAGLVAAIDSLQSSASSGNGSEPPQNDDALVQLHDGLLQVAERARLYALAARRAAQAKPGVFDAQGLLTEFCEAYRCATGDAARQWPEEPGFHHFLQELSSLISDACVASVTAHKERWGAHDPQAYAALADRRAALLEVCERALHATMAVFGHGLDAPRLAARIDVLENFRKVLLVGTRSLSPFDTDVDSPPQPASPDHNPADESPAEPAASLSLRAAEATPGGRDAGPGLPPH